VAEPTLDLAQAKRLMDALYEAGDTIYVCAYHDRNKLVWCQSHLTYDDRFSAGIFIRVANGLRQAVATTVGVFAPEAPGFEARRTEDQCVGLSAFGIDIDRDDLAALVPGATTVEEVLPEVVRRLEQAGIPLHAVVRSGRGLHVYILIKRVKLTTNEERTRAKDVWFRLTKLLGGASDRYDLSSYLRVPGTVNRKGEPVRVEFVEEHTHLDRQRFTMEQVAAAVAHLPGLPAEAAVRKERKSTRSKKNGVATVDAEMFRQDPWDLHLFGLAMRLDKSLAEARQVSLDAPTPKMGTLDRSKNDFHYASRMLELGLPASIVMAELALTARGRVESQGWRVSTFSAATQKVYPTRRGGEPGTWSAFSESDEALFTGIEGPAHEKHQALLSSRGDSPASASTAPTPTAKAVVSVVLARPGKGKTRGIVHWLATNRHLYTRRLGVCGSMVRELLRHEYAINAAFPFGLATTINDMPYEFEPDLPEDHEALWARLPAKVKERIATEAPVGEDGNFRAHWTLEKLKVVVTDPAAFHINARHPLHLDEAIQPHEDEEGHYTYPLGGEKPDPVFETQPAAVVKFRGRPDLCLAGRSAEQLRDRRTCLEWCDFSSCRSNMNSRYGGAKTYWTDAAYPLLTHKAFETHAVVNPSLNDFQGMVFDELPAMVYRYPKLRVSPDRVKDGRAKDWQVHPIDSVVESFKKALASLDTNDSKTAGLQRAVTPVLEKLEAASKRLRAKGSDLLRKTMAGDLQRGVVKADTLEPLLSLDEFAALMKLGTVEPDVDEADADESAAGGDQAQYALLNHLSTLRDFCESEDLDVFMECSIDQHGTWSLRLCRPVNGWPDLLNLPAGSTRPTVLLDATAGLDPRYLLAGQWDAEETPDGEFPNTTVVLTDAKYRSKSKVKEMGALDLAALVVEQVMPYLGQMVDPACRERHPGPPRLLVVTAKNEMKEPLRAALLPYTESGKLPAEVAVEHFGGLRGRNDFRDFDAVYLTHLHLYDDAFFFGLELLLRDFGEPFDRQWVPKATWYRRKSLALQHRAQVADIYQDALRIGIRSDPTRRAFIFLPTSDAGLVVRVMRLFRGARLVLSDGEVLESPLARPPPAAAPVEPEPAPNATGPGRFGTPR
jgi:hypothetical protein